MATGIKGIYGDSIVVRLVENLAAANSATADGAAADVLKATPTSTTFFDLDVLRAYYLAQFGVPFTWPDNAWLNVYETAGTGTMTIAYLRLWSYDKLSQKAFPPGPGADADKGKLNGAAALGETGSDKLRHKEVLAYPLHGDGIQIEFGAFGGTNPTYNADLHIPLPHALLGGVAIES